VNGSATALQDIGDPGPLTVRYQPIKELIPYARNARTYCAAQAALLAGSIRAYGFTKPLIVRSAYFGFTVAHQRETTGPKAARTITYARRTPGRAQGFAWRGGSGFVLGVRHRAGHHCVVCLR
jgi:hypothetical protein